MMETVWVLFRSSVSIGTYSKEIVGVYNDYDTACKELDSIRMDTSGAARVTIDMKTQYELSMPGQVLYYHIEQHHLRGAKPVATDTPDKCPQCGGKPQVVPCNKAHTAWRCECSCGRKGNKARNIKGAITSWNAL